MEESSFKTNIRSVTQEITCFNGTWRYIKIFTRAPLLPVLSQINPVRTFQPNLFYLYLNTVLRAIRNLSSSSSDISLSVFPARSLYAFITFPLCAVVPRRLLLLDLIDVITFGEELSRSSECSFLHSSYVCIFSSAFCVQEPLSIQHVLKHVSHPRKQAAETVLLCTLILKFLGRKREDKTIRSEWRQAFPNLNLFLKFMPM